ncbi:RDD family protein [Bosea sp. (in: a-proteobacteria)]|uniref:RDD family protein n=1 Tax=Bosea sp. (in: a-proteobacteria) TaxID=1871050 RepID=UPI0027337304|nr:RDD family protein [Bosea sp. (in: a-proteobacteria)]MDP3409259.1 RDD family protein [Bosea sp. (in: a-proteobacteria)]
MTDSRYSQPPIVSVGERPLQDVSGVLGSRIFAWIGDIIVLAILGTLVWVALGVLGIVTFGATWLLIPIATVATALGYAALTIGGPRQATWGMRMAGLRVETASGGRPDGLAAAVHALLFYVAASTVALWVLDILCGIVRSDRRLGHDLLTGLVIVRA